MTGSLFADLNPDNPLEGLAPTAVLRWPPEPGETCPECGHDDDHWDIATGCEHPEDDDGATCACGGPVVSREEWLRRYDAMGKESAPTEAEAINEEERRG